MVIDLFSRQIMSRRSNCYDNAVAESCFGTIKREIDEEIFETRQAARTANFEYIEIYFNRQRLHSTRGYRRLPLRPQMPFHSHPVSTKRGQALIG